MNNKDEQIIEARLIAWRLWRLLAEMPVGIDELDPYFVTLDQNHWLWDYPSAQHVLGD